MAGPAPVSFQEIEAWARMTKTTLPGWEVLMLRQLSKDFVSQYHDSSKPDCPCPGDHSGDTGKQFKSTLARFKK